jgi:2-keto-4-pentenoate hydratase/2-oxohepta-3-ene-1,7-dioic acid hydratase in catechol pathway
MSTYSRLVRFQPTAASSSPLIGQPRDPKQDVGLASYAGEKIEVDVFSGKSILAPGEPTGETAVVETLLSPLAASEVGTIRCIGLNVSVGLTLCRSVLMTVSLQYVRHAEEVKMDLPTLPVLFMKPSTALADPFPAPTTLPKAFIKDNSADYESEVVLVIGKDCKNVSEADALDYLLGFTASNDVSSRVQQFAQSQWGFSKSFDGACPIGPAFVHKDSVKSIADLTIRGSYNNKTVQESGLE